MRRARKTNGFSALRVEGGIFPPEFLQTVAAQEAKHQDDRDYGISRSLNLKDELARYWRVANDLYAEYAERRERADLDPEQVGVDEWLVPLLRDVFGYQDLTAAEPAVLGERRFPITHRAFGGAVPLVLTTRQYELDRGGDPRFGEEGRRRTPHGLMQEYLNATPDVLWGIVCNGTRLRLLRDNPSLTRPAYIEGDLELIFEDQLYADFAALWLTIHATRLRPVGGKAAGCILEVWRQEAQETGQRALDNLREGVAQALRELGTGFLEHPANECLRAAITAGELTTEAYFQELLRLVYRLLFLFTAEDRDLLHPLEATDEERRIYRKGYSLARLRERAARRRNGDRHCDLWQGLQIVFRGLAHGAPALGLPALGGLFAPDQCPHLDATQVTNERLLAAIRALSFFPSDDVLVRVNYRDMGTEELGSVYESLLDLHPRIDVEARPWVFGFVSDVEAGSTRGSARKLTGSYYTPSSLVNELIKSALEPVMEETIKRHPDNPRAALLNLKIIDPACGSGHFLLAAARRMAAELARLETGSDTPDELVRQRALRQVVQHCIYGVDRNPLAVELCRAALWMETLEPGKPLTFLEPHIQCGDSLVGILDPKVLEQGIPDEAYNPLTGDDKAVCRELKRRNRESRRGVQLKLFDLAAMEAAAPAVTSLEQMPEETLGDVEAKRKAWAAARASADWQKAEFMANLYVAAFFAPKTRENKDRVPLTEDLHRVRANLPPRPGLAEAVAELAARHRFFHWHLAFPEVMQRGGFDVVLGNPPWERVKLQEEEFFEARSPQIARAANKAERDRLIKRLRTSGDIAEKKLYEEFMQAKRNAEATSLFVRGSGRFPLTGIGDVNLYALFAEHALRLLRSTGRAGIIVPTGIATDAPTQRYFNEVVQRKRLVSLFDFRNKGFFPGAASAQGNRFCLMTLVGERGTSQLPEFAFRLEAIEQLTETSRRYTLSAGDIALVNPNTKTCPVFRTTQDAELAREIYRRVPVLVDETRSAGNPWGITFLSMFHSANDSHLFRTASQFTEEGAVYKQSCWIRPNGEVWVPLYEAKMIHHYDHRFGDYSLAKISDGKDVRQLPQADYTTLNNPAYEVTPRYWVPLEEVEARLARRGWNRRWLMGWRDIASSLDERTVIAAVLPRVGTADHLPLFFPSPDCTPRHLAALIANFSALVLDFIARLKVGGTSLKPFVVKQLPFLPPTAYSEADLEFIVPRVVELTYTSYSLRAFAQDLEYDGPPYRWDPDRRAFLRAELDAYYAYLYGLTRDELRYVLDPADVYGEDYPGETFRRLKQKGISLYGEYRTRRLVLEAWDRLVSEGRISPPKSHLV